jgi:hypothetical protein
MGDSVKVGEVDVRRGKTRKVRSCRSGDRSYLTVLEPDPDNMLDRGSSVRPVLYWVFLTGVCQRAGKGQKCYESRQTNKSDRSFHINAIWRLDIFERSSLMKPDLLRGRLCNSPANCSNVILYQQLCFWKQNSPQLPPSGR